MLSSNASAARLAAMVLAALLIQLPGTARAGEGLQIIASLIKAIQSPGRIDYAERINAPLREGVTPENNFFAAIFPLTPLDALDESDGEWVQALCDEIGCVHPAEEPLKFVAPMDVRYSWDAAESEVRSKIFSAKNGRWTPEENPVAQAWVLANEAYWKRVVEAASRSRAYRPLIPPRGKPLLFSLLPDLQMLRAVADLGAARAHQSIARKDLASARADLLTVHRVVRHAGQASSAIQLLVAYSLQRSILIAETNYLSHPDTTLKDRESYLAEISRLPVIRRMRDVFDSAERWSTIDGLDFYRRGLLDPAVADEFTTDRMARWQQLSYWLAFAAIVDWSDVNDGANTIYDLVDSALSQSTEAGREDVVDSVLCEVHEYGSMLPGVSAVDNGFETLRNIGKDLLRTGRTQRSLLLGKMFAARLLPDFQVPEIAESMYRCRSELIVALVAVLGHVDRTKKWPVAIDSLCVVDGRVAVTDQNRQFTFRIAYEGYTVRMYNFGPDGVDHGGNLGEQDDGNIADDQSISFYSESTPSAKELLKTESVLPPFWVVDIPREWKGVGIILASLSFGAISLWLRRRKA